MVGFCKHAGNPHVAEKTRNFLISWATINFSKIICVLQFVGQLIMKEHITL
jgi:hypothetical protein